MKRKTHPVNVTVTCVTGVIAPATCAVLSL
jgi:hypothetical protein